MAPYWSWANKNKSLSDIEDFLQDVEKVHQQDNPSAMYFGVFDKNENRFLGCLWYADINWFVPRFEIAYWYEDDDSMLQTFFKAYHPKMQQFICEAMRYYAKRNL